MKKKQKIIAGVLLASMLATTGCSIETGDSSPRNSSSSENNSGETLTIMMNATEGTVQGTKDALDKAAEIMGVNIEISTFPDDQFLNIVNTKGATENLDDIILTSANLPDLPYQEFAPLKGDWIEKVTSSTAPFLENPDKDNDDILLAPLGSESNYGFAYNKTVLENAGVELPIMNYADFLDACEKIKAIGVTPVYISDRESWTAQIILQASFTGVLENQEGLVDKLVTNQVKPQDVKEIVKLWQNVADLQSKGYVNEDCLSATHEMAKKAIANGEAGFYAVTDSAYGEISSEYPDLIDDVGMTICPMWDSEEDAYVTRSTSSKRLAVNKNSENLDLAKEFVNTCMSQEVLEIYYNAVPGNAPFDDPEYELAAGPWNEEMQALEELIPVRADWGNQAYDGELKFGDFWGDFDLRGQSLFAGVSPEDALTQWYEAYAESAKAKRLDGWE